jgi:hypothetical protein
MSAFTHLKRNCPVCDGARRDCRQNKQNGIVHCRADLNVIPSGWKAIGQDKWGFEMYAPASEEQSSSGWQQRRRERKLQQQREKQKLRRGALPEAERDTAIRWIHRHFGISSKHRQNLRDRGLRDAHIDRVPYFSFHADQEVPAFTPANLPGVKKGRLAVRESGFACPILNVNGTIIGWQNRFDDATNGKYRWPSGEKSIHLPSGELPIGVYRPDSGVSHRAIGQAEGFLKADVIAQQWGLPVLGAASANFAASPEQWRDSLERLSAELCTRIIYWFADAGSVSNPNVTSQYVRSWEKLTEWGYEVQVVWYGQIQKSAGDADEVSNEVRESAQLISIDEYLAIAREHGGIKEESPQTPDTDRPIDRDRWELKFGLGRWLKKKVDEILGEAKGFGKKAAAPPKPSAPKSIIYYPKDALPEPADYERRELPRIIFKKGKRLEVLAKLKELGWKFVCDRSFTGSGKSHDAGLLHPDSEKGKIWYFDTNHTNPSTETIEEMVNMPPRHNGMAEVPGKVTPKGNPHLRWAKSDEVPMIPSLCHHSDLFIKLKSKGWNVDIEKTTVKGDDGKQRQRNPICKGCRFAHKCHQEIGEGYGYLFIRREVIESRRIRASLDSAPSPVDYGFKEDIAFVEEASKYLRGTQTLSARGDELAQLWEYVERKTPEVFAALQSIRFGLQDALNGEFNCIEKGRNRGADHETLANELPHPNTIANLPSLILQVKQAMPSIKDVVEQPDGATGLGGKWRGAGQSVRNKFKAEATQQTKENIEALPPNILVDALEIWAGLKAGSLRVYGKQLHVTVPDTRHADALKAFGFVVLLDATPNTQYLEKILGDRILEIEEERPPLSNLTAINANMEGMGSSTISQDCKERQLALVDWVRGQHQEVKVLANKADTHLPLDGHWFNDNRGSNAFKGVEAIAAFNLPRPNLGVVRDDYRTLFGSLEGFQDYYQQLIQSEVKQLVGRQRVHQYPDKQFTLYLAATNQDLSYLTELGCQVVDKEAFELTPFCGSDDQITKWQILEAVARLQEQGQKWEKWKQETIGSMIGKSQALISKTAKKFGGWPQMKILLLALLKLYRGGNNFEPLNDEDANLIHDYFSPAINALVNGITEAQSPEAVEECLDALTATVLQCIDLLGYQKFVGGVRSMPVSAQSNLLSVILRGVP